MKFNQGVDLLPDKSRLDAESIYLVKTWVDAVRDIKINSKMDEFAVY